MCLQSDLQDLQEQLFNLFETHVLKYHVSLGNHLGGSELPPPIGSGTFVKFSIPSHTIYGILTAAHVIRNLKLEETEQPAFVGLSKLHNGETIACSAPSSYIHCYAEIKGFASPSADGYRPDIAFILLGIDECLTDQELITNSSFWDLDANVSLVINDRQIASVFYRGAAPKRPDGLLDTAVCIGGGEILKFDDQAHLYYWEVPNTSNKSIRGGSGAGFWRFDCNKQTIVASLEGVVISEESFTYSFFEAMSPSSLYDDFLPKLKDYCSHNLNFKE